MDKEIKQQWLQALRSGDYRQRRDFLKTEGDSGDLYCCLGVLCDIYAKSQGVEWEYSGARISVSEPKEEMFRMLGEDRTLPLAVSQWAGFNTAEQYGQVGDSAGGNVRISEDFPRHYLAILNDTGMDFEQIAKIIEERL